MKKAFAILFSLLLCAGFYMSAGAESLNFSGDGELKILILADPQDTDRPQQAMLDLLNASLDAADPDLVVFLGDMLHAPSIGNDLAATKRAIDAIVNPVVERGLQFAVVFGNHDDEGGISKETQLEYYQSFPGCLAVEGEPMTGCGNYYLTVNGADGVPGCVLWFFDSGTYDATGEGTYACVEKDQIDWYKQTSAKLTAQYGELPGFVFQHIIVPEIYDLLSVVPRGTKGAVRGIDAWRDHDYILNPENTISGTLGEGPCPPVRNQGQFGAWVETGDIKAAFFGHDHVNDFIVTSRGVDLVMTPGLTFYIYGNGEKHGTRVVTLRESDLSYTTDLLYYKDIVEKPLPAFLASTQGVLIQNYIFSAAAVLLLLIAAIVGTAVLIRRKRNLKIK